MPVRVSIVCALGRNRAIGRRQELPWRLPEDLKRFKRLTMNHVMIMGRKTFESIGRPLPGRSHVIVTRNPTFLAAGCAVCGGLGEALDAARRLDAEQYRSGEVFVIGGGEIYAQAMEQADRLYLTLVDDAPADADTFFPEYTEAFPQVVATSETECNGHRLTFEVRERAVSVS